MPADDFVAVVSASRWGPYVSRRLEQLLRGDGDFAGLQRPTEGVVTHARNVAADLFAAGTATPSVVPDEDGNVMFVWHKNGWYVELTVGAVEVSVWVHDRGSDVSWGGPLPLRQREFSEVLADLAG